MPEITLVAEPRNERGSAPSRRLRTSGRVPAVVYGHGVDPVAVSVDARALRAALSTTAGQNALFDLHVGARHELALARAIQRHPVRQTVSHVDFQVVRRDEVVSAEVPVVCVGEALAVHRGGGTVEQLVFSLSVRAKPGDIPSQLEVDVTALEIGQTLRIEDLSVPEGAIVELDADTAVVTGASPHAAAAEAPETAEGEAAATEEGSAPSGEDS